MKRKLLCIMAIVLALAFSTTALAATTDDVQTLWRQVGEELEGLREKNLTDSQQETLRSIQNDYFALARSDNNASNWNSERADKITSFVETLSEAQKTAFEDFIPQIPAEGAAGIARPDGTMPERPTGEGLNGERPAPPSGERPDGTPPTMPEGMEFAGSPPPGGMAAGTRPQGEPGYAMTDEEREAMKEKRDAFTATLSEAQKAAYEDIFPANKDGESGMFPLAEIDLSAMTSSELADMEERLNSMLAQLKQLK